jgi:hypothetical protein
MKPPDIRRLASNFQGFVVFLLKNYVKRWRDESRQLGAVSLLIELKGADSLLDIASCTFDIERRENIWKKVVKSYNTVVLALALESLSATQRTEINQRLDNLRTRLQRLGIVIERNDGGGLKAGKIRKAHFIGDTSHTTVSKAGDTH